MLRLEKHSHSPHHKLTLPHWIIGGIMHVCVLPFLSNITNPGQGGPYLLTLFLHISLELFSQPVSHTHTSPSISVSQPVFIFFPNPDNRPLNGWKSSKSPSSRSRRRFLLKGEINSKSDISASFGVAAFRYGIYKASRTIAPITLQTRRNTLALRSLFIHLRCVWLGRGRRWG